jgi:hypothetical protein
VTDQLSGRRVSGTAGVVSKSCVHVHVPRAAIYSFPCAQKSLAFVTGQLRCSPGTFIPWFDVQLQSIEFIELNRPSRQGGEGIRSVSLATLGGPDPVTDAGTCSRARTEEEADVPNRAIVLVRDCEDVSGARAQPVVLTLDESQRFGFTCRIRDGSQRRDEGIVGRLLHDRDIGLAPFAKSDTLTGEDGKDKGRVTHALILSRSLPSTRPVSHPLSVILRETTTAPGRDHRGRVL